MVYYKEMCFPCLFMIDSSSFMFYTVTDMLGVLLWSYFMFTIKMLFLLCVIIPVYLLFLFANLKSLLYLSLSLIINSYSLDLNDYITISSILKKGDSLSLLGRKISFLPASLYSKKMRFFKPISILLPFIFFFPWKDVEIFLLPLW